MEITELDLPDVHLIELEPHVDHRGHFMRVYDDETFEAHGLHGEWVQENHSYSKAAGTVRGMHFQFPPDAETKLVRVVRGKIFDTFVDLRRDSSTFGEWDGVVLSAENRRMLYVPRGFAHGFCTLTDDCDVTYKVDSYYAPENEGGIRWDDPELGIDWPVDEPILSEKDGKADSFEAFVEAHSGLEPEYKRRT